MLKTITRKQLFKVIKNPLLVPFHLYLHIRKASIDLEEERRRSLEFLSEIFDEDAHRIHAQYLSSTFKTWYDSRTRELITLVGKRHVTGRFDCATLYILVRLLKPNVVVETGVLYGGSSSHMLEALKKNGVGQLYSIDLPNEPGSPPHDFLIRPSLRDRWHLTIGDSKTELPELLNRLKTIDFFYHDSLHTFEHMLWEYETAFKHFTKRAVLTSHDVLNFPLRNPFMMFCRCNAMKNRVVRNLGIALRDHEKSDIMMFNPKDRHE